MEFCGNNVSFPFFHVQMNLDKKLTFYNLTCKMSKGKQKQTKNRKIALVFDENKRRYVLKSTSKSNNS